MDEILGRRVMVRADATHEPIAGETGRAVGVVPDTDLVVVSTPSRPHGWRVHRGDLVDVSTPADLARSPLVGRRVAVNPEAVGSGVADHVGTVTHVEAEGVVWVDMGSAGVLPLFADDVALAPTSAADRAGLAALHRTARGTRDAFRRADAEPRGRSFLRRFVEALSAAVAIPADLASARPGVEAAEGAAPRRDRPGRFLDLPGGVGVPDSRLAEVAGGVEGWYVTGGNPPRLAISDGLGGVVNGDEAVRLLIALGAAAVARILRQADAPDELVTVALAALRAVDGDGEAEARGLADKVVERFEQEGQSIAEGDIVQVRPVEGLPDGLGIGYVDHVAGYDLHGVLTFAVVVFSHLDPALAAVRIFSLDELARVGRPRFPLRGRPALDGRNPGRVVDPPPR